MPPVPPSNENKMSYGHRQRGSIEVERF